MVIGTRWGQVSARLTGAGIRRLGGTNTVYKDGETMASVGIRVELTDRDLHSIDYNFSHFINSASVSKGDVISPRNLLASAVKENLNFSILPSAS